MSHEKQTSRGGGDRLEVDAGNRPFDISATAWLVGQGVRHLNTADKEGELAYARVVELLRRYLRASRKRLRYESVSPLSIMSSTIRTCLPVTFSRRSLSMRTTPLVVVPAP